MLIQNIETIRRFIPNALVTVQRETTLYDKMQVTHYVRDASIFARR